MEHVTLAKASAAGGGGGGNLVLILDYGSQYTHLITRRIRQLSVFSLCISGTSSLSSIAELNPRVIILSGGPHSVHVDGAPSFPDCFLRYAEENGVYVLGICYGMQLIVQKLGGRVAVGEKQEYGKMEISVEKECGLYCPEAVCGTQTVWMSHGDEVVKLPEGFTVVSRSLQGSVAAIENHSRRFFGLQYHPELLLWRLPVLGPERPPPRGAARSLTLGAADLNPDSRRGPTFGPILGMAASRPDLRSNSRRQPSLGADLCLGPTSTPPTASRRPDEGQASAPRDRGQLPSPALVTGASRPSEPLLPDSGHPTRYLHQYVATIPRCTTRSGRHDSDSTAPGTGHRQVSGQVPDTLTMSGTSLPNRKSSSHVDWLPTSTING